MATPVIGNTSSGTTAIAGTTLTISHTVLSTSSLLLATVGVRGTTVPPTVSATYGGVAMTQVPLANQTNGALRRTVTFYLLSPASGTADVVFTFSENLTEAQGICSDWSGVNIHTGLTFDYVSVAAASATSDSVVPQSNTTFDSDLVYAVSFIDTANNQAPANSQTEIADLAGTLSGLVAGYKTAIGNSTTIGWTFSSSNYAIHAFAVRPIGIYSKQPDETDGIDNFIQSNIATTNSGTSAELRIGESNAATSVRRTLIKFVLSGIPSSNVSLLNAQLSLWVNADLSSNARDFKIYRSLRAWLELESTWNVYTTGNNWTSAGADSDGNDTDLSTVWATTNFTATESAGTEKVFTLSLTELLKFIDGTYTNNGWLIKADTETNDAYTLESSSSATATLRPKLVIQYSAGYEVTVDQGSYTYTGQTTGLLATRLISVSQGAYTYTGQAVGVLAQRLLSMAQGAYTYTGQAIGLTLRRILIALHILSDDLSKYSLGTDDTEKNIQSDDISKYGKGS